MAALADADRFDLWAAYMREALGITGLSKADLRAAVNAADAWADANAAAFNTALPLPARTALTAPQKARLLTIVAEKRWVKGS